MIRTIVALAAGCFLFLACNNSGKKEQDGERSSFSKGQVKKATFGSCDTTGNKGGVSVVISMWEPSDSGTVATKIRDILAGKTINRLNSYTDSASIAAHPEAAKSPKAAFEVFEKNYNDFKKDFPDSPGCWEVELHGDTVMATPKVLFYQLDHYSFTGGAHPNSFTSYHAFDSETGDEREMKTFIADSVALLKIVEKKFREIEKLAPGANLEEAGYPYEIAAYARGPIEFTIPYNELEGIVEKDAVF
jgi:hypothetical protein